MISLLSGGKAARFVRHGRPLRAAYERGSRLRTHARQNCQFNWNEKGNYRKQADDIRPLPRPTRAGNA